MVDQPSPAWTPHRVLQPVVLLLFVVLPTLGASQNLIYFDLTTHGDDQIYEDANNVKNSFQTYGQRADLTLVDLKGRIETTQHYFLDLFKTSYSNSLFFRTGMSLQLSELAPLITRTVQLSGDFGRDGFYNVNDGTPPVFSKGFHYGNSSLSVTHNEQLSPVASYNFNLSYQSYFKENEIAKNDTLLSYNGSLGYERQFSDRVVGGATLSRNESIDQNDITTVVTTGSFNSTQNLTQQWTLSENIGVSQFRNPAGRDVNTVGGIQATYSYGVTLNDELKSRALAAEGERKLPDTEYREAIDDILNPEEPDVLSFGWQRQLATINQGQDRRLADTFNISWLHVLTPNSNIIFTNNRTHESALNDSATADSVRNNMGAALNISVKWLNFAFSRTPEQQITLSYTYERFSQGRFWSDFTITNIAFKALL